MGIASYCTGFDPEDKAAFTEWIMSGVKSKAFNFYLVQF